MNARSLAILVTAIALGFNGCATPNPDSPEILAQVAAVGYGSEMPATWPDEVKSFMEIRLKDAGSAQYKFGVPEKSHFMRAPARGGGLDVAGYTVTVLINAKNSYGGYVGFQEYGFFFRDGKIVKFKSGGTSYWENMTAR